MKGYRRQALCFVHGHKSTVCTARKDTSHNRPCLNYEPWVYAWPFFALHMSDKFNYVTKTAELGYSIRIRYGFVTDHSCVGHETKQSAWLREKMNFEQKKTKLYCSRLNDDARSPQSSPTLCLAVRLRPRPRSRGDVTAELSTRETFSFFFPQHSRPSFVCPHPPIRSRLVYVDQ